MKKILAIAVASAMMTANAGAQSNDYYETNHEVGVTVGAGSMTEIISGIADMTELVVSAAVTSLATLGTVTAYYEYGDESYLPTISAEYYWHVNKVVGWGGFVSFNGMNRDMYMRWTDNVNGVQHREKTGVAKRRNVSVIPMAKIDWLRKRYVGLYSKAGLGLSFMHETQKDDAAGGTDFSETTVIPNGQISFLGLELGSPNVRAFAELGFGEQGMALAGLKWKF